MGHIDQQQGAAGVGDLAELGEVEDARVGGVTGDEDLRPAGQGLLADGVIIEQPGRRVQGVALGMEILAGYGYLGPVGEVAAVGQGHAENGVAGLEEGEVDRQVGR